MPATKVEPIVRRSLGRLHDTLGEVVGAVKSRSHDGLHRGAHAVHDAWDETRGLARGAAGETRRFKREHSLVTLGIGLGLGLLVSVVLRRPSTDA